MQNNAGDTNAPVITITWPQSNTPVAATNFTLLGMLDDPSASLVVLDALGNTNQALVERTGRFTVANLALPDATNVFTLIATDAAGNTSTTNLTVLASALNVTINPLSNAQWSQPTTSVTGTVNDSTQQIYVNGVAATVSNGVWEADNVPVVPDSGLAQLQVTTYPAGSDTPSSSFNQPVTLPPVVRLASYLYNQVDAYLTTPCPQPFPNSYIYYTANWQYGVGGTEDSAGYVTALDPYNAPSGWRNTVQASTYQNYFFYITNADCYFGYNLYETVQAQSGLELAAGGAAQTGVAQLIRLTISATLADGTAAAVSALRVLGLVPTPTATNANVGELYVSQLAGTTLKLDASINGESSYTGTVQAEAVSLRIFSGTNDVTGLTNITILGVQANLHCGWSVSNSAALPAITSCQWSVQGNVISNYYIAPDTNSAMVIPLMDTNHTNLIYYYADGGSNLQTTCTVTAGDQTYTAQTAFNVIRPSVNFTGQFTAPLVVDTNWSRNPGGFSMHLGDVENIQGITITDNSPETFNYPYGPYNFLMFPVQTLSNLTIALGSIYQFTNLDVGLDNDYPYYPIYGDGFGDHFYDSPGLNLVSTYTNININWNFRMCLMFQESVAHSIAVPLREIDWQMTATAVTNGSGGWVLVPSQTNEAIYFNNVNTTNFPVWTNRVSNIH